MRRLFFRVVVLTTVCCAILFGTSLCALAQTCQGAYFKPTTKKIFSEQVEIAYREDFYRDMNGDGTIDVVAFLIENDRSIRKLYVYLNIGGTFGTPKIVSFPADLELGSRARVLDYNSDGKYDIVARVRTNPPTVNVYLNDGAANFTAQTPIILTGNEEVINVVDINGDGRKDLISNDFSYGSGYRYRLANADGTFAAPIQIATAAYAYAADFNGDGRLDFPVVTGSNSIYQVQIYFNLGNGVFNLGSNAIPLGAAGYLQSTKDFNNDGRPDLFFADVNGAGVKVLTSLGNENFGLYDFPFALRAYPSYGDFNGDGAADIFLQINEEKNVIISNLNGNIVTKQYNRTFPGIPLVDFDGDGKTDLLQINNFNDSNAPQRVFSNETRIAIGKNICQRYGQTKIIDFDGDGKTEFVFYNPTNGRWRYQKREYQAGSSVTFNWGQAGDIPVAGDYDGDGKTDYAIYRPSNGIWYYVQSEDNSPRGVQFGASEDKPVPADYNGDGKTDFAVYRPSIGIWYVLMSGTYEFYAAQFGASEDRPVPEDYDGDGKTDFAVFRPSNGYWYVLRSSDNSFFGLQFGLNTDTLVPADYDGDGKADIAVYRPGATSYTYINRADGLPVMAYPYGSSGDIPQNSDWNADGVPELGVYRPTNKTWYLMAVPAFDSVRNAGIEPGEVLVSTTIRSY